MCRYEVGDVIHYSGIGVGGTDTTKSIDAWVLTTDGYGKCVLIKGSFDETAPMIGRTCSIGDSDPRQLGRRVVPPEEWPDDVATRVVSYKLTGVMRV